MSTPPRSGRRFRRLTFAAALLACAGSALAQTPAALPRLDVATTPGTQLLTGVAVEGLGNGNVTLLWNQLFTNGALTELARGRRFSAADVPLGPDIVFQSSTSRPGGAAANVRGAAVLSWNRPRPGGGTDVVVRRTSPLFSTANLVANGPGALSRGPGDVAIDRNGNFVAVWDVSTPSGIRVFGQRFNANGTKRGPEFNAVTSTDGNHGSARVAMNPATGEFVAVWVAANTDGTVRGIFGQRFGFTTGRQGSEFQINTTGGRLSNPDVGRAEDGSFVVVWKRRVEGEFASDILGQRYNTAGARAGREIVIADRSPITDGYPRMAMDLAGNWVVAWDDGAPPLFVRLYRRNDMPAGPARELVNGTTPFPGAPELAFGFNGTFVLGWTDFIGIHEPDDDNWEVNFQRFAASPGAEICLFRNGRFRCDTNGGGELEVDHVFAIRGGVPLLGDVDDDGRDDYCLFRGTRFDCDSGHNYGAAEFTLFFGLPGDTPLLGDVNGDGREEACVFRAGHFLCDTAHDGGAAELDTAFGQAGDRALLGDVDGDGRADACVVRAGEFQCDTAHNGGTAETVIAFGAGGVPLLGDVDNDGREDPCVFASGLFQCDTAHNGGTAEAASVVTGAGRPLIGNVDGL